MTSYPVLVEVQSEMARMKIIYDLYSAFEKFREDMSLTAWGELDVEVLKEGVDRAEKEIKKLPKDLKELSKYKAYELVVVNFKESLPVIVNLKNDAVKQVRDSVLKLNLNLTWESTRRVRPCPVHTGPLAAARGAYRCEYRRRQDDNARQDFFHGAQPVRRGRRRDRRLCRLSVFSRVFRTSSSHLTSPRRRRHDHTRQFRDGVGAAQARSTN